MKTEPYSFAALKQSDIDRIRELERQLSSDNAAPVTLIAYQPAEGGTDSAED